jgi:hypothetical protein
MNAIERNLNRPWSRWCAAVTSSKKTSPESNNSLKATKNCFKLEFDRINKMDRINKIARFFFYPVDPVHPVDPVKKIIFIPREIL